MIIIKTPPELLVGVSERGRPPKYPFENISSGQTLVIEDCSVDDLQRVKSALYQYKKNNKLSWFTSVRMDGNNIYVTRF